MQGYIVDPFGIGNCQLGRTKLHNHGIGRFYSFYAYLAASEGWLTYPMVHVDLKSELNDWGFEEKLMCVVEREIQRFFRILVECVRLGVCSKRRVI